MWYKRKNKVFGKVELYPNSIVISTEKNKQLKTLERNDIEKDNIRKNKTLEEIFEEIPYNITSYQCDFGVKICKQFI